METRRRGKGPEGGLQVLTGANGDIVHPPFFGEPSVLQGERIPTGSCKRSAGIQEKQNARYGESLLLRKWRRCNSGGWEKEQRDR